MIIGDVEGIASAESAYIPRRFADTVTGSQSFELQLAVSLTPPVVKESIR